MLSKILAYCEKNQIHPTTFGKLALGDPSLVRQLRAGRDLRLSTVARIEKALKVVVRHGT